MKRDCKGPTALRGTSSWVTIDQHIFDLIAWNMLCCRSSPRSDPRFHTHIIELPLSSRSTQICRLLQVVCALMQSMKCMKSNFPSYNVTRHRWSTIVEALQLRALG